MWKTTKTFIKHLDAVALTAFLSRPPSLTINSDVLDIQSTTIMCHTATLTIVSLPLKSPDNRLSILPYFPDKYSGYTFQILYRSEEVKNADKVERG